MQRGDTSMLESIWNAIQMLDTKPTGEELNITKKLERIDKSLLESLDSKQKELFIGYVDLLSELNYVSEREAFIKGVKFATRYILEIEDD